MTRATLSANVGKTIMTVIGEKQNMATNVCCSCSEMGSLGENCSLMPHTEKHYGALKSKIIPTIPVKSKELTSERESRDSKAVHKQKK